MASPIRTWLDVQCIRGGIPAPGLMGPNRPGWGQTVYLNVCWIQTHQRINA